MLSCSTECCCVRTNSLIIVNIFRFESNKSNPNDVINKEILSEVKETTFLRLLIDQNLTCKSHINLLSTEYY